MYDNALRCIESDYPTLLGLTQVLGAIKIVDNKIIPEPGVSWDFIGYKEISPGSYLEDGLGNKYVHVNVRTPFSVGEKAAQLASESPEVAVALSEIPRFFITDNDGNPMWPEFPMRVFL